MRTQTDQVNLSSCVSDAFSSWLAYFCYVVLLKRSWYLCPLVIWNDHTGQTELETLEMQKGTCPKVPQVNCYNSFRFRKQNIYCLIIMKDSAV